MISRLSCRGLLLGGLDDFISYIEQVLVDEAFENQDEWIDKSITSVARMGFFSSDRVITEYKVSGMWSSYRSGKGGISEDENSNRNLYFFLRVKAFEHTSNDISVKQMHFLVSVIPDVHVQYLHLSISCTIRCIHC